MYLYKGLLVPILGPFVYYVFYKDLLFIIYLYRGLLFIHVPMVGPFVYYVFIRASHLLCTFIELLVYCVPLQGSFVLFVLFQEC